MDRRLSAPLVFLCAASVVSAQGRTFPQRPLAAGIGQVGPVDSTLFKGLRYRMVGPNRGGRVTTVTGVPSQPKTFYMGVASGGLFRTTDGGANWVPITDGKVPLGSTGCVAVADSDPNTIYLGTGSDDVRSNVSTGRGMYKTNDGGLSWKLLGRYKAGEIGSVRSPPRNPTLVGGAAKGNAGKSKHEPA